MGRAADGNAVHNRGRAGIDHDVGVQASFPAIQGIADRGHAGQRIAFSPQGQRQCGHGVQNGGGRRRIAGAHFVQSVGKNRIGQGFTAFEEKSHFPRAMEK